VFRKNLLLLSVMKMEAIFFSKHPSIYITRHGIALQKAADLYEGWNFNSGNYLFTADTK